MSGVHRGIMRRPVPLSTWIWSLAFAPVLFYVLTSVFEPPNSEAFHQYNSWRVTELRARAVDDAEVVILLGDSRLRYATHADDVLSARITEAAGRPVETLRIVNNWAVYDDFASLIDALLDTQPSLIVVQFELMSKERAQQGRLLMGSQYLLWRFFGNGDWNPGNLNQALLQDEQRCEVLLDEDLETRRARVFRWVNFDANSRAAQSMQAFVAAAQAQRIHVAFIQIPISSEATAGLPAPDPMRGLDILAPPIDLPDSRFCDLVHLNPQGRDAYSDWLVRTIADVFQGDTL